MTGRNWKIALAGVAATGLAGLAAAQHLGDRGDRTTAPTSEGLRKVVGRSIESPDARRSKVEIADAAFKYVGGHRFVLYGVANAEQHVFADADDRGRIRRLYWVQFEGYLPSSHGRYDYSDSEATAQVSGVPFHADGGFRGGTSPPAAKGSDSAMVRRLIADKGLHLPAELLWQRLVWVDASGRDELMVVYMEDLAGLGLAAADLGTGGDQAARAAGIKAALRERAAAGLRLASPAQ